MKKLAITLVMIIGIVVAMSAFERDCDEMGKGRKQYDKGMGHHDRNMMQKDGDHFGMMCEDLDLDDAQQDKIEKFRSAHRKEMIELKADIEIKMVDKRDATRDKNFAKMKKITSEIFSLKESIALKKIEQHEKIWNISNKASGKTWSFGFHQQHFSHLQRRNRHQ